MYFASYRLCLWEFREARWQPIVRNELVPVSIGLVIASGTVMVGASYTGWASPSASVAAIVLMLSTRINPLWMLLAGGILGGVGLLFAMSLCCEA